MNFYQIGVFFALVVFFVLGIYAGRKVRSTNDYFVAGRNAPTLLVTGSLIASFLSTGAFLGDTGEVYEGFFMAIVIVGIMQASGYIYGAGFFGRYIRRSKASTLPEYFCRRFDSPALGRLASLVLMVSISAYLLSAIQGVATLMSRLTAFDYRWCTVLAWFAFTAFTIYSGSPGVLLTDTVMFMVFLVASLCAVPFVVNYAGGWFEGISQLARYEELPGFLSWTGYSGYMYPDGMSNLMWAISYGVVWALVVSVSPWQTSRYLMARNEHVVLRSSIWSSIGVMLVTLSLYFMAAFIRCINADLPGSEAVIWAAMNILPPLVGVLMLTGITAAGLSSASTFLSLIGFSLTNDILPLKSSDSKVQLNRSRLSMLIVSLIILALAWINPPQIFWIMYFGGTVIASSWSVAAFAGIWCPRFSKTGAFLSMLLGFVGCAGSKLYYSLASVTPPVYLDSFFIGIFLSIIGAVIGSLIRKPSELELANRAALFIPNPEDMDEGECKKDARLWVVYLIFGLALSLFFIFFYAVPFKNAIGA